jgi:hypothetical protein
LQQFVIKLLQCVASVWMQILMAHGTHVRDARWRCISLVLISGFKQAHHVLIADLKSRPTGMDCECHPIVKAVQTGLMI